MVGGRVRRLRQADGLRLVDLTTTVTRPDGGDYSIGFFSRLERGWASPPLWVYVRLAEHFGVHPGRLLGVDDVERPVSDGELTLVRLLRRLGIEPDEALGRLLATPSAETGAPRAS